jgi:hypothetical protein
LKLKFIFFKGITKGSELRCSSGGFEQVGGEGARSGAVPFDQVGILPSTALESSSEVFDVKAEGSKVFSLFCVKAKSDLQATRRGVEYEPI